uniref:Uncharacterized protein n=1 Tax=Rhizophora mucronata TaxID=61149 RepID=A0A2P2P8M8_RHIMU
MLDTIQCRHYFTSLTSLRLYILHDKDNCIQSPWYPGSVFPCCQAPQAETSDKLGGCTNTSSRDDDS